MTHSKTRLAPLAALAFAITGSTPGHAQGIEVLYTKIDASPTSNTPWTLDLMGQSSPSKFRALEDFSVSHDGSTWVLKGRNRLGSDLETMLVLGDAAADPQSATNLAQEGQPIPGDVPGALWDFFDSGRPVAFDTTGNIGMSGRSKGPATGMRERLLKRDTAGNWTIVLREGDPLMNLTDTPPTSAGDEALGNSVSGVFLLDDGRLGYLVTPIQNCSSFNYPAFLYDDMGFLQTGASAVGAGPELWDGMDLGDAGGTPDGSAYYIQGDTDAATNDDVLTVNNQVVLREGQTIGAGGPTLEAVFQTQMAASGDWISRGDDPANDDWLVLNGSLIAKTGDPVEGGLEAYNATFAACAVNANGDWALIAGTDEADDAKDEVLVVNGVVIAREGDPIDLDGNGAFDDGVFLGDGTATSSAFAPNDLAITDSGMVYFIGRLNDGMGNDLDDSGFSTPDAFLRLQAPNVSAPGAFCFGDGSQVTCPCGNNGSTGEGCVNSTGPGAILAATGDPTVGSDTLVLNASQCPAGVPGVFFQGNLALATPTFLSDGLLCVTNGIQRLETVFADGSGSASSGVTISIAGSTSPGDTRYYQYWYRDNAGPCSQGSNTTNAVEVIWQ